MEEYWSWDGIGMISMASCLGVFDPGEIEWNGEKFWKKYDGSAKELWAGSIH